MNASYDYHLATRTSSYQSVSELKRLYEEPRIEKIKHFEDRRPSQVERFENHQLTEDLQDNTPDSIQGIRYTQDTFEAPRFIVKKKLDFAQIGTIHHFFMQQLDFETLASVGIDAYDFQLTELANQLQVLELLKGEEVQLIQLNKIKAFLLSDVGQLMIQHYDSIKREKAFSYLISAQQLFESQLDYPEIEQLDANQLLIHGIIDSYFETEAGLIIIDYKTDRFKPFLKESKHEQRTMISDKYKFQLSLYANALESATGKPVTKAYLALLDFEEVVMLEDLYHFNGE